MISIVTIKDIAKEAGVSVATVSHVINETRFVSDELQERVKKIMEKLDYYPNLMAGSLRRKRTNTIGLIVPDNSNPLFAELSRAIEDLGFSSGYSVMLCNSAYDFDKELKYIRTLRSKRVDGLIIIPTTTKSDHINQLVENKVHVVVLDRTGTGVKADMVSVDNFQGAHDATMHLINSGHCCIGYIDRPFDLPHSLDRVHGYSKALEDKGIKLQKGLIVKGGFSYEDGAKAMQILLKQKPIPTAVIAFNDITAIGAIRAIKDQRLKVPEDISIIGFDDIPQSSYTIPRLTTVHFPKYKMAEAAYKLLTEKIEGSVSEEGVRVILPTRLIIRNSTSKVKPH